MDDFDQTKSCWGVTLRAVVVFAGVVAFTAAINDDGGEELAQSLDPSAIVAAR